MEIKSMTINGGNQQFSNSQDCIYLKFLGVDNVVVAWSAVYFGANADPIKTIGRNLVNVSLGYDIGSGAFQLLNSLGLVIRTKTKLLVTEKGHEFLNLPFLK